MGDIFIISLVFIVDVNYFQINYAVSTNRSQRQWVDLGIYPEACMTLPETCGAAGGAVSMWLKIIDCEQDGAMLSTRDAETRIGFHAICTRGGIR